MEELHVTRQSKWNEFEAAVQERFQSQVRTRQGFNPQVIAGKAQRDLFYAYVDKLRNREEKAAASIQAKLKQDVYDLFEEYMKKGLITLHTK